MIRLISYLLTASCLLVSTVADEQALLSLIKRLNSDVIQLRNEVEYHYARRCDAILGCTYASYDECLSEMSAGQTCPNEAELGYAVEECGSGINCNGLIDFTSTTVRLPNRTVEGDDRIPKNPLTIEVICSSRKAEGWMVRKYKEEKSFWESLGVAYPQMYIGSATGMFRIFPGRQSRECGSYDPRERPWYKGAVPGTISNSAPRHIVFLLDKSLSMGELMSPNSNETVTKLDYMKQVVKTIMRFLTDNDSVAVVTFAETARVRGHAGIAPPYYWKPANVTNVQQLMDEVDALQPSGRSNWIEGFDETFDLIEFSLKNIVASNKACAIENVGLLFFSDGDMNLPAGITDPEVTKYVQARIKSAEAISTTGDFQIHPFLYSIGNPSQKQAAKEISCASNGLWKPIVADTTIRNVTIGYETLFSTPLGDESYMNYTTWSNPYTFTSSGETGYTVSALLYDRSVNPPRYIGAVGIDFLLSAAMKIYEGSEEETIKAISRLTSFISLTDLKDTCAQQAINLTYCELQSLRYYSGGDATVCIPEEFQDDEGRMDQAKLEAYLLEQNTTEVQTVQLNVNETDVNATGEIDLITSNKTNVTIQVEVQSVDELSVQTILQNLNCSSAFVSPCPGMDEYPSDVWNNVELKGMSFEDRSCCQVGTSTTSDQCPKMDEIVVYGFSDKEIFAFIIVPLAVIELLGCYFCFIRKRVRKSDDDEDEEE